MEKIPTIFERGNNFRVIDKFKAECDWVARGEGIATEKIDGTNIRVTLKDGKIIDVEKRRNPNRKEKEQGAEPTYVPALRADPSDKWIFASVDYAQKQMLKRYSEKIETIKEILIKNGWMPDKKRKRKK